MKKIKDLSSGEEYRHHQLFHPDVLIQLLPPRGKHCVTVRMIFLGLVISQVS